MLASVMSLGLAGIEGFEVVVEVNLAPGMPAFDIVGLPDAAVKEARERVRAALRNCGEAFPMERLTVNLAPADRKKEGPAFDLPIALGILACTGRIDPMALRDTAVFGELSLDGGVRPVRGALPMVISALEKGVRRVVFPQDNVKEVRCLEGVELLPVARLRQAVEHFSHAAPLAPMAPCKYADLLRRARGSNGLLSVRGQRFAQAGAGDRRRGRPQCGHDRRAGSGKTLIGALLFHDSS